MSTDLSAIAAALRGVRGITAAAIDPDEAGEVAALRVLLDPGMDGLEAASAVSRVLHEQLGADVESGPVHVVDDVTPLRAAAPPEPPALRGARPAIVRTGQVVAGLEVTSTVLLSAGARHVTGQAHSAASEPGMQRATALAALDAVQQLVGERARLDLEHLAVTTAGGVRAVLVTVTMMGEQGSERLVGATAVCEDEGRAVVQAVLDAVNRRLESLLG